MFTVSPHISQTNFLTPAMPGGGSRFYRENLNFTQYMHAAHQAHPIIRWGRLTGFLLFLAPALCFAQRYPFYNLNVEDGLVQSQATCLAQDNKGNLWIGTLGGLARYDGHNFTDFTEQNGLMGNTVLSLAIDAHGAVWAGGQKGVSAFDGKKFSVYGLPAGVRPGNSQQLQAVGDTIWWRTLAGVYYVANGALRQADVPGQGQVYSMLVENSGIWLARDTVLYHRHSGIWDTVCTWPASEGISTIRRIYRDAEGTLWAVGHLGIFKMENGRLRRLALQGDTAAQGPWITSITQDKDGALWLGASKGAIKISGGSAQWYNKRNGLTDNTIYDVLTDRENNVWLATDGQGIFRFSGTQFSVLDESMGLPSAQVMAIASNNRDSLLIGTYDAGIFVFKDGKIKPLEIPSRPPPSITALLYSSKGKLWIGTKDRGLWSYQNDIYRQYAYPERKNFPSNTISGIYEDPMNRLWVGFVNGAGVFDNDNFKITVSRNAAVTAFLAIGQDSVLIAAEGGLMLYHDGVTTDFKTNTIADSANIQCFIDLNRELWMGSSDKGIIRYNLVTGKAAAINKASGLRSDFIYNIIADSAGDVWAGTGFGIHRIHPAANGAVSVTFYGRAQGITGMESNMNAVLRLRDNSIWFGTTNGAMHCQPHTVQPPPGPSSIQLVSVKLVGETAIDQKWYDSVDDWYGVPYHLKLPFRKNNISFAFQAVSLSGAQQLLYRYCMDGLDVPWSDWSATNSVSYSALPPGHYVFRIQCRGSDAESQTELDYTFDIIAPFQKTQWFRLATLAACILTGIVLQYIFNTNKRRRERLLDRLRAEEQNKIRLRTAEDFHDEIGNKLTRINVLTSVLKNKIQLTPDTERILGQIEENTGQLYSGTRDILWSLKPSNDNLFEILQRIRDFGSEMFNDSDVEFTFNGVDERWRKFRLPMDMSRNLIMIFKEALNNCMKYAHAKHVWIDATLKNRNVIQLVLRDDGQGFDTDMARKGNGINNMNIRASRLGGRLYVDSRPGKGTIISLTFKLTRKA